MAGPKDDQEDWEAQVLAAPGTAERVREIEDELILPYMGEPGRLMKIMSDEQHEAEIADAERRGWDAAVAALRDEKQYEQWCYEDIRDGDGQSWPYWHHAPRFADYLDAVARKEASK